MIAITLALPTGYHRPARRKAQMYIDLINNLAGVADETSARAHFTSITGLDPSAINVSFIGLDDLIGALNISRGLSEEKKANIIQHTDIDGSWLYSATAEGKINGIWLATITW